MVLKKSNTATFAPKEMVLAKMTGFPAWPSFVMPPEMIPEAIMKAKKKTTNMCVIFIPDGDFNWMNEKSLEPLTAEKLSLKISKIPKDKLKPRPKNKSGRTTNVAEALVAANNLEFDDFMDELNKNMQESSEEMEEMDNDDEIEEDEIENEDEEIEQDAAQDTHEDHENNNDNGKRPARHSKGESGDPSMEDADRRKRRTRAETPLQSKRARNNKSGTELESKTDKSNSGIDLARSSLSGTELAGTELAGTELAGSDLTNTSNLVTSDLDKADERGKNGDSPRSMSEKDRQHQLWLCRIKLQRSLIQRNQPVTPKDPTRYPAPTVDELSVARIILNRLADFPVSVELLKETKIHKVLRCILKYEDLEYPDSFRLHEKCNELLQKWQQLIDDLKQEKNRSRMGSQVPEDSEVSGIEVKKDFGKVEV